MTQPPSVCTRDFATASPLPSTVSPPPSAAQLGVGLSRQMTLFFAAAVGIIILNLSAAPPLTGPVIPTLNLPVSLSRLLAKLPQFRYPSGNLLRVPPCAIRSYTTIGA